jgi:hypothetical protein
MKRKASSKLEAEPNKKFESDQEGAIITVILVKRRILKLLSLV